MKVIKIRWRACCAWAVVLIYLGVVLVFFGLNYTEIQPIDPLSIENYTKSGYKLAEGSPRKDFRADPAMRPRINYSQGRMGVKDVIGIPSRPRIAKDGAQDYVLKMVQGLIQNMTPKQQSADRL